MKNLKHELEEKILKLGGDSIQQIKEIDYIIKNFDK